MIETNCAICLGNICNAKLLCGHFFHSKCILKWVNVKKTCPICRRRSNSMIKFDMKN